MAVKVLLAEDEEALGSIVKESLETRDFEVNYCKDGESAWVAYQEDVPDVLVLDVMMPKLDGFSLAKRIRETDRKVPIIFLTAKSQTQDVLDGFQHGGNDYLKKPFSMEELIVRINSLLDRVKITQSEESIKIGSYDFNKIKQQLRFEEEIQPLTHRESELLFHLSERRNEILDRSFILSELWGSDDFFTGRSMDVFITKLRKKLKKDASIQIVNVRGYGYKLIC